MDKAKTCMEEFFEKFPNAPRAERGEPKCCPVHCYSDAIVLCEKEDADDCNCDGVKCWSQLLPTSNDYCSQGERLKK